MRNSFSLEDKGQAGGMESDPELNLRRQYNTFTNRQQEGWSILIDHWSNYRGKCCFKAILLLLKVFS